MVEIAGPVRDVGVVRGECEAELDHTKGGLPAAGKSQSVMRCRDVAIGGGDAQAEGLRRFPGMLICLATQTMMREKRTLNLRGSLDFRFSARSAGLL